MKMKTLIPFIVILAVLLGFAAWQKSTQAPPAPIATQIGLETLSPEGLTRDNVQRISLFAGSALDEAVVLERDDGQWRISSQFDAPANAETVDAFIDKLLSLKGEPRATADTEERLADFALTEEGAFHVQAFRAGADTPDLNILVGKAADFRTVFLREAGSNRVFVESVNLRREAGASDTGDAAIPKPTKWLKTALLEVDRDEITAVALDYPDKALAFERHEIVVEPEAPQVDEDAEGEDAPLPPAEPEIRHEWKLARGGAADSFTETELDSLLNRFANLTVTNAVDPERAADWGFDPPAFTLTLSLENGDDVVLRGGREKPGGDCYVQLVGSTPELIYQISKFNFEQIFLQGSKLFTLPEWSLDKEAVESIAIERPDGRTTVRRIDEQWRIVEPELDLEAQKTALDNLVSAVASLKPTDYAEGDVGAFDTVITIALGEGETRVLRLGPDSKHLDGRYARFDDGEQILVLSRADATKLTPPARDLYALEVLDFDSDSVREVALRHDGVELLLLRADDDGFEWTGKRNGAPVEAALHDVQDFLFALSAFQVDNFLLDRAPESVADTSVITLARDDGADVVLRLGPENADGFQEATVSGLAYVFSVRADELARIVENVALFPALAEPEEAPGHETEDESVPETAPADVVEFVVDETAPALEEGPVGDTLDPGQDAAADAEEAGSDSEAPVADDEAAQ